MSKLASADEPVSLTVCTALHTDWMRGKNSDNKTDYSANFQFPAWHAVIFVHSVAPLEISSEAKQCIQSKLLYMPTVFTLAVNPNSVIVLFRLHFIFPSLHPFQVA